MALQDPRAQLVERARRVRAEPAPAAWLVQVAEPVSHFKDIRSGHIDVEKHDIGLQPCRFIEQVFR